MSHGIDNRLILQAWKNFCIFRESYRKLNAFNEFEDSFSKIAQELTLLAFHQGSITGDEFKKIYESVRNKDE